MEFRVLGSVGIVDGEQPLPLGGSMPRKLLAVLLAHRNHVVSTERLVDVLWPDPPESAGATLQSYVSRLRRFTELSDRTALVNRAPGYVLELPEDLLDAGRFEVALADGQRLLDVDPYAALERLDDARRAWRGAAFAEFADADTIRPEAVRLEELRLVAMETRVDAELRVGRHQEVVGELEALLVEHPLRERFSRQLMLAMYRGGRQGEALRVAQRLRTVLRDELGLEPSSELRDLETAILEEQDELSWSPPAIGPPRDAMPSDRARRHALPAETTTLVGRDGDLDLACRLFESGRALTLFGPGGVGKTRLALRVAATVGERFDDGVRLVELAPVREQNAVSAAVADALDVQQRPNRSLDDSIVEILAARRCLLLLDNCEHVLDTASELVELILRWCPNVNVLATSREPLGVPGEVVWSVPPLPVPASRDDTLRQLETIPAVQLFVERAAAARPDFVLDATTAPAVAEICIRLDGVPLAIELAAARMRSMSAIQLADRLPERFRVLAGSRRATDPRHRTLRDLVQWSYELLTPAEQRLFDRLSVFAGSFSLERAERVCAGAGIDASDIPGLLIALVDKSMLVAETAGPRTRYRLLETLREFGRTQLDESPDAETVRKAHARVHVELAETAAVGLGGADEARWIGELDDSFDDMREAHAIALAAGDVGCALHIVVALREYAWRRIRYELLTWAEATIDAPGAKEHGLFPTALAVVAYGRFVRGEFDEAVAFGERSVEMAGPGGVTTGLAERALANIRFYQDREVEALAWMDRMVDAADALGVPSLVAHAYYMRSVAETSVGNAAGGAALAEQSAAAAAQCGSPTAYAQADFARGIALEKTDAAEAERLLDRSVRHAEKVGNRWIRAFSLTESLWIGAQHGDPRAALDGYRDVIDTWFRGGDWANQWLSLRHVFAIFETLQLDEVAAMLYGALEGAGVMRALPVEPANFDDFQHAAERLAVRMGERAFDDAVSHGRTLRDEEVVRMALDEIASISG